MLVSGSRFPPGLACAETSFQTSTSSVTITVAPTQGVSTPILVQTAATVAKMCHASPVVTGGLASGSFSPLGFKSFHSTMTGSGSSAVVVNDPSLANMYPFHAHPCGPPDASTSTNEAVSLIQSFRSSVDAEQDSAGPEFALTRPLPLCAACPGSNCEYFGIPGGDAPGERQEFTFNVPDSAGPTMALEIELTDFRLIVTECRRVFVSFDDSRMTLVQ
ncbi:MAG: hypothetical protein L6R40_001036 [Gallowayella cf. fulva]|nr:MAG: hypothetical protein L6R40_001036 [Xanthomendoza cf. fulva]